jgi:hypothetical protein
MTTSTITAIDLLSPPPLDISYVGDTTLKHRLAAERERVAWKRLTQSRLSPCPDERSAAFAEWVTANNELREAQSLCTSTAISKAMEEMRGCAALLARDALLDAGARGGASASVAYGQPRSFGARPQVGQVFQGRGGVLWTVANVTEDMLEPELFLVQMECSGGAAADEVHDVSCEDWALFCVVLGLAGARSQSH